MGKAIDLTGQRFGRLVAVRKVENSRWGAAVWLCQCDCGLKKKVYSNILRRGLTRSCGCLRREASRDRKFKPHGEAARNQVYFSYQVHAAQKAIEWALTEEQFIVLSSGHCRYCGCAPSAVRKLQSGSVFVRNGIDRKDSTKGYTNDNVVPCCKTCNYAKRNMPQSDFVAWIQRTAVYLSNNPLEETKSESDPVAGCPS